MTVNAGAITRRVKERERGRERERERERDRDRERENERGREKERIIRSAKFLSICLMSPFPSLGDKGSAGGAEAAAYSN